MIRTFGLCEATKRLHLAFRSGNILASLTPFWMVHSAHHRQFRRIAAVRRGLYRVYRIDPRKHRHALSWQFDAAVAAVAAVGFVLYLVA